MNVAIVLLKFHVLGCLNTCKWLHEQNLTEILIWEFELIKKKKDVVWNQPDRIMASLLLFAMIC